MKDMDDLDNLLDNFNIHSFWQKKRLAVILGAYLVHSTVIGVLLIRAVLNSSDAGAVPKGMELEFLGNTTVIR